MNCNPDTTNEESTRERLLITKTENIAQKMEKKNRDRVVKKKSRNNENTNRQTPKKKFTASVKKYGCFRGTSKLYARVKISKTNAISWHLFTN